MSEEAGAASAPRRTPLHDEHVALGARMVDFAGWSMPVQYSSILAEHAAVRTHAGLFDVSHMGEVEISGAGAEALCAKLFTNDARTLEPGRAQYSMIANDEGGVVDDIIVYRLAADRFLVCVNASNAAKDVDWIRARADREGIRARATDGATIDDRSDATGLIAIQGPHAKDAVEEISPGISAMKRFTCERRRAAGIDVLAARTGYTGEDGFELFCPAERTVDLWRALVATKTAPQPCGLGARDTLRVEAALPLYGHELGPDISPYEVGLGWAVKRNRPDMVGYAALERAATGGAGRRLVGLLVDGGIAREGAAVFQAGAAEPAGKVTSGTHSPTLGRAVALALVDRSAAEPFEIELRGKRRAAAVTSLPFCVKRAAS